MASEGPWNTQVMVETLTLEYSGLQRTCRIDTPAASNSNPTGESIFAPVQIMERTTPPSTRTAAPVVAEACSEAR